MTTLDVSQCWLTRVVGAGVDGGENRGGFLPVDGAEVGQRTWFTDGRGRKR